MPPTLFPWSSFKVKPSTTASSYFMYDSSVGRLEKAAFNAGEDWTCKQLKKGKKLTKQALSTAKGKRMRLKELRSRLAAEIQLYRVVHANLQPLLDYLRQSKAFMIDKKWIGSVDLSDS